MAGDFDETAQRGAADSTANQGAGCHNPGVGQVIESAVVVASGSGLDSGVIDNSHDAEGVHGFRYTVIGIDRIYIRGNIGDFVGDFDFAIEEVVELVPHGLPWVQ